MSHKSILFMIPLLIWTAVIFHFSSQPYQKQTIIPFLHKHVSMKKLGELLPDISVTYGKTKLNAKKQPFQFIEFVFRKSAHIFVYFILGMCGYFALIPSRLSRIGKLTAAVLAVIAAASLDEWNQALSYTRTGQVRDIGIDVIGGGVGALLCMCVGIWVATGSKGKQARKTNQA